MMTNTMKWSWKEVFILLILILILVPFFIEYLLHDFLYTLFQESLYSGTLTGLIMAIVFTVALYFVALKPHDLSWDAVGVNRFPTRYWKWIAVWTISLIVVSFYC
ncbi:hypothetical protein [Sutcliffiella cohnii]|uniref:hypothetical protein n=1 Tax=Sutcliffiella cohnii TaxID=33932 RepID=UPI000A430D3D